MTSKRKGRTPEEQALFDYQDAGQEFVNGGAARYIQGEDLDWENLDPATLAQLQQSQLNGISVDPQYKNAELDALRALEEQAKTGLTARDEADMAKLQSDVNRTNRGRIGAIQQNMAARGLGGSGMELVAQMQAAQDAADREAMAALEQSAVAGERRNQATNQRAALAGQMGDREYQQKANAAQANDVIARFNVTNRVNAQQANNAGQNSANQANWQRGNQTSDNNVNASYDHRKNTMGVQQGNAQMANSYHTEMYNRQQAKKAEAARKRAGTGAMIGGVLGAAAGTFVAPGVGTAMGAQMGSAIGQNFAYGGTVKGPEIVPGSHPANDVIPSFLSAGEKVLPKEVANDPQAAAQFVAKENQKNGMDPRILDYLAKSNPDLVAQYRSKIGSAEQGKADASQMQMYGGMANTASKIAHDYANSQKSDTIYANDWMRNGGGAPKIDRAERPEYDGSAIDKLTSQGMSEADKRLAELKEQMKQDYAVSRDMNKEALDAEQIRKGDERYATEYADKLKAREDDKAFRNKQLEGQQADRSEARAMRIALSGQAKEDKAAALKEKREHEAAVRKEKTDLELQELNVPGYDRTGEVMQGKAEASNARDAVGTLNSFKKSLSDLNAMIERKGSFEWGGEDAAVMDALGTNARMQLKKLDDLGVINGPDLGLMLKQIPDTSSIGALFTRDNSAKKTVEQTSKNIERQVGEAMKAKGYAPQGQNVQMKDANGQVYSIPASEVDEATKDGLTRI